MARHHVTRVLPYSPQQLLELVGDVKRYPEFVPWITSMRTWNEREEEGVAWIDAEATVGFKFLRERFATRVKRDPLLRTIEVSLLHGPFRRLDNRWAFLPDAGGSRVEFDIDFAFKSSLLDMMLAANFDRAVQKLMACFEARAAQLYGRDARAAIG
ncbi:MAG TPA: SRPBCC family protein [Reyranella sp.]|nr:SRPBCC family protein [Reyranella sp.]